MERNARHVTLLLMLGPRALDTLAHRHKFQQPPPRRGHKLVKRLRERVAHVVLLLRRDRRGGHGRRRLHVLFGRHDWGRARRDEGVQRARVHADALEELAVEADAGVGLEALADHPPERDAVQAVFDVPGDVPPADVCMQDAADVSHVRRRYSGRTEIQSTHRSGPRRTRPPARPSGGRQDPDPTR